MSSFETYFYRNLGRNIRKYREKMGITQEGLAEILNLNEKYFGHVERFEKRISLKVVVKLLELWHLQPNELYSFETDFIWEDDK